MYVYIYIYCYYYYYTLFMHILLISHHVLLPVWRLLATNNEHTSRCFTSLKVLSGLRATSTCGISMFFLCETNDQELHITSNRCITTSNKKLFAWRLSQLVARTLLGAPGITASNKDATNVARALCGFVIPHGRDTRSISPQRSRCLGGGHPSTGQRA